MSLVGSIVAATTNVGKLREMRYDWHRGGLDGIHLASLSDYPRYQSPTEDQPSFIGNAIIKARAAALHTGAIAMADDSGLCVATLGGAPGVKSARYASTNASDEANNAKLVAELKGLRKQSHPAAYVCVVALASPIAVLAAFTGRLEGEMVLTPRGQGGFGYDPYFFLPSLNRTAAELTIDEKTQISHRGAAMRAAIGWLRANFTSLVSC
jgi:XTP/dITP diphosphohydrolase